ncbi:hypothetical protein GGI35DRAFT_481368 [Trichoderma velutinum]
MDGRAEITASDHDDDAVLGLAPAIKDAETTGEAILDSDICAPALDAALGRAGIRSDMLAAKFLRACHDLVQNLVKPLSRPPEPRMGKTPAKTRKELQPQPGLQPQSGPLASEAFLDRQRTGGLWAQQPTILAAPRQAKLRQTLSSAD